jgi:hypothetical protein
VPRPAAGFISPCDSRYLTALNEFDRCNGGVEGAVLSISDRDGSVLAKSDIHCRAAVGQI